MKKKAKILIISLTLGLIGLFLNGCNTFGEAKALNPTTGRIDTKTSYGVKSEAKITKSEKVDLSEYQQLLLALGNEFFKEQTKMVGFFDRVVDREEMEKLLIEEDLTELVSDVTNYLSWKKISDKYGKFLVLKPDIRDEGSTEYVQLKAIDPSTAEDLFVAEIKLDYMWKGVHDDSVFYPLYNAFLEWMEINNVKLVGSI